LVPVGGVPVIADGMAFIVGNHLMVGSGHEAGRRIEGVGQLIERAPSLPVVAAAAGYGQQAGPWRLAARRPTGGLLADIALRIAINKIFRGQLPAAESRAKIVPVLRAVNRERGQVSRAARLGAYPTQRQRAT